MCGQIKMSHSIHILCIQIELVNINLSFFTSYIFKGVFLNVGMLWLLGTLELLLLHT